MNNSLEENRLKIWPLIKLCVIGVVLNLVTSYLVLFLGTPLYMDCTGTVLVALLGGTLPGMIVAFITSIIWSFNALLNLYYFIPAVLISATATILSRRGGFRKWYGAIISAIVLALVGSVISTILGWYIFGEQINGNAAILAFPLSEQGVSPLAAQFIAEFIIDFADKLITVIIVMVFLHFYPKKLYGLFTYSYIYENNGITAKDINPYKHSVNNRVSNIVTLSIVIVGIFSLVVGSVYYQKLSHNSSIYNSQYVASKAALCVDGNRVADQFEYGEDAEGYKETEERLNSIYESSSDIRYLYVYVINESGCYALYDIDVPGEAGRNPGEYVDNDPDIYGRIDEFIAGGEVEPGIGNNTYGTLISAYVPIHNSAGETVAYACADIDTNAYIQKMLVYIIQLASLIFVIILIALSFLRLYINRHVAAPIKTIVKQTKALDGINPENWLDSDEWKNRIPINTKDEFEELYITVTNAEENASINVKKRLETEQELLQTKELESINQELENKIREADEANRAKTDFLSRMSHDMRTPMNAIIGLSALTLDDADNPEIVRNNMAKMRSSSDFLLGLVNDILDLAKIEDGAVVLKKEPYMYSEFYSNMYTMFKPQCDAKGIKVQLKNAKVNPVCLADKLRLNQIFFNIFSNAVKYTPTGGTISFDIENLRIGDGRLHAEAVIKDTGIGMSEEYQKHLFEPFAQENNEVSPELKGSGLGLSITKQLVDLMGGTLEINSRKGIGTEVRVAMDFECVSENASAKDYNVTNSADDSVLKGKRVLIAEDHPLNAQIARRLLEKKGMIVTHAENGKVAVEIFDASTPGSFDVVLMDIRMPEMSGLDATRAIRELDRGDAKTVAIIAMSANAYSEDVQKSLDAGMNGHLAKPVNPDDLYNTLSDVLGGGVLDENESE